MLAPLLRHGTAQRTCLSGHRPSRHGEGPQCQALFERQAKLVQRDAVLAVKDFKITPLTHELAHYKRVRFGKARVALADEQRLLFDETVDMDLAAIDEELEAKAPAKRQRERAGRQPLLTHLERIEHRHEPGSCQCDQCGADSATRGISDTQKQRNRRIATQRARVEHVFGALARMGGKLVRCKGIVRTNPSLHLKAVPYNLKRLVFLKESGLKPL